MVDVSRPQNCAQLIPQRRFNGKRLDLGHGRLRWIAKRLELDLSVFPHRVRGVGAPSLRLTEPSGINNRAGADSPHGRNVCVAHQNDVRVGLSASVIHRGDSASQ
jgi:hypothetical protein